MSGFDINLNYYKHAYAMQCLKELKDECLFIATNLDATFPASHGRVLPGTSISIYTYLYHYLLPFIIINNNHDSNNNNENNNNNNNNNNSNDNPLHLPTLIRNSYLILLLIIIIIICVAIISYHLTILSPSILFYSI